MKNKRSSHGILHSSIATLLTLAAIHQAGAANATWNGATGGTWHTVTNWTPNTLFPGEATAAVTGEGLPTDIAFFTGANVSTNVGINMNTMGGALSLGAIDMNRTAAGNLQIGNNSTTVNGVLQLNGATVNGVANTLIRVTGTAAADLTIANVNTGTGTQTMGVRLGNANGLFTVDTGRALTISSIISQLAANSGFTKNGAGTMVLTAANTYTGPVLVSDGVLRIANATALGTGTGTITITNTGSPTAADNNELHVTGGITVNRSLVLENTGGAFARASLVSTNATNGNGNTWSGSILFRGGSNQAINANNAPLTLSGSITNDVGSPSTGVFFRGGSTGTIAATATVNLGAATFLKTDGGTWNLNNTASIVSGATQVADGTLQINANNAISTTAPLTIGQPSNTSGTLSIASGITQRISSLTVAAGSTGTQRVSGLGSLDTGASNITFTINDSAGIPQDLIVTAPIIGTGGFTKVGAGTLAINNSVEGASVINAGRLEGTGTFLGGLTVNTGAILSPNTDLVAGTLNTSGLTFGAGTTTVNLNVGSAGEFVNNTGGIAALGTTTINFTPSGSLPTSGQVTLITHDGSFAGTAGFSAGTLPGRVTGNLINTGSAIALDITGNSKVVWTGLGAPGTTWDIGTTQNWRLEAGGATTFVQGDDLIFDDTGTNTTAISLGVGANPARADFRNNTVAYKIVGAGGMGGSMILDVSNGGNVTLAPVSAPAAANASAHTYVGATNVTNGTLTLDYTGLTGTNGASARVISPSSAVTIGAAGTLAIQRDNVNAIFANNVSGTGTLRIDPTQGGTAGARNFSLSGDNSGFSGQLILTTVGGGTTGTFRTINLAQNGAAPVAAFGTASVQIGAGAQMWGAAGTYSNNIQLAGAGFAEAAGGNAPDADLVALGFANYAGIGAIRMDNGSVFTGNFTLTGPAKIQAFGGTATINGSVTNTGTEVLVVGGGNNNATNTLILAGDNSGLERIWVNSSGSGGTSAFDILQIGANGTTGTLGSGDVTLHADAARGAGIRFSRADGYTLGAGQNIVGDVAAAADYTRLRVYVNSTGSGFTINNNTIDISDGVNGGNIQVAGNDNTNGVNGAVFNINGAASLVDTGNFFLGDANGFGGSVNQTDGTVNVAGHMRIGHWPTETSNYSISGGTLNFIGATPGATPSGTGEQGTGGMYLGIDGTGNFTQSGTSIVNTKFVVLDNRGAAPANATAGTDTYTLSGGTLNLQSQWGVIARHPLSTQFNLDTGTIVNAAAAGTAVVLDTPISVIGSGGVLDTSANATNSLVLTRDVSGIGSAVTLTGLGKIVLNPNSKTVLDGTSDGLGTQTISADLVGTGTPIEKINAGTTILSGNNIYTGPTTISGGTLVLTGSLGNTAVAINAGGTFAPSGNIGSGGGITLNAGGVLAVGGNSLGLTATGISTGALTIGGGTVNLDFTGTATDTVDVTTLNGLTINAATVSVVAGPSGWVSGTYPVYTYVGTVQGAGAGALTTTNVGHTTVTFADNLAGTVNMTVNAVTNRWVGGAGSAWDIASTLNWNAVDQQYLEGDNVRFDDTATSFTPSLAGNVNPATVNFANSANNYSLGGAGGIAGNTSLSVNGGTANSTATLAPVNAALAANASAHTYTGGTNVNTGTLVLDYTGLTGTNAATARVINSASLVTVAPGATLKAIRGDAPFTLSNPIIGGGTVELNAHSVAGGTTAHSITLNGNNVDFTGTLVLGTPVTGTYRLQTPTQAALGSAAIDVKSGAQLFLAGGTYSNNITIAGTGFADASGNIGALRIDGATYTGNVIVNGTARIGAHNSTGTITGEISGGDLEVNVTNFNNGYTVIFTGANSYGSTTIGGGNTQTAGVPSMRLNIGNGGTTGTLGTGPVTIYGDGANGVLGFDRLDGYTLAQTITSAGPQLGRTFIDINTTGTGFDSAGFAINLGSAAAGGNFRVGQGRAGALGTISGSLTGANVQIGSGANLPGATLNFVNGANVAVNAISVATASTNATLNIDPGAIVSAANTFWIGEQNGFAGTVNQTGGSVSVGNQFRVGHWPNETSTYNLSGSSSSLEITSAAGVTNPYSTGVGEQNGGVYIGIDGVGIMNQSDGNVTTNWVVIDNRGDSAGVDQYNLSGGNLNIKSGFGIIQRNASGEFNFTGGVIKNVGTGLNATIDAPLIIGTGGTGTPTIDTNGASNAFTVIRPISGAGDLAKIGAGTLNLNAASPLWSGDLYAEGGTTVATTAIGDGTSSVIVDTSAGVDADDPALVVFTASQTLEGLTIGDGATVTLANTFPAPPAPGEENLGAAGGDLGAASIQGVPEPGSATLLFGGMLTLLGLRRRSAKR